MTKLAHIRIFTVVIAMAMYSTTLHATSLTAGTTIINLSCTKGSTCASSGTSTLAISTGTGYYTVTSPSVPWLLLTPVSGIATTTASANVLTFSASPAWTTLGSGYYTTTATIASLGVTSATVTVHLQVNDATPTLGVQGSVNILNPVGYTLGGSAPTMSITV
jgi:hypothetical protein